MPDDPMCREHREKIEDTSKEVGEVKISLARLEGDIGHIKDRIDNGISGTLKCVDDKLNQIIPKIDDNSWWLGMWKRAIYYIAVIAVGGGLVSLMWWFVRNGINKT